MVCVAPNAESAWGTRAMITVAVNEPHSDRMFPQLHLGRFRHVRG
jgi:hypothetical protein